MNLKSQGQENLIEFVPEIRRLERANSRARRERERLARTLGLNMDNEPEVREEAQGAGVPLNPPLHAARRPRVIGAYDAPQTHGNRSGIRAPPVDNNNFEIIHNKLLIFRYRNEQL